MATNPRCAALAAAMDRSGLSYAQIATQIGSTEQRVVKILTCDNTTPTHDEFQALARVLDFKDVPPEEGVHKTA